MSSKTNLLLLLLLCLPLNAEVASVAHPGQPLPADQTVVWTPLFQAAWDGLNASYGGPPLRVVPANPLIADLDSFKWDVAKVMPTVGWKTWAGPATSEFLDSVNPEAAKLLGRNDPPFKFSALSPERLQGAVAFYGAMARSIEFEKPFHRSRKAAMAFRSGGTVKDVHFFGVRGEESEGYAPVVRVLAWRPVDRSHAIQVTAKDGDDTLVLYLPSKPQGFVAACHWIRTWRDQHRPDPAKSGQWDDPTLHEHDEIQVPYLKLESATDFASLLQSERFYKDQPLPRRIQKAELKVRFDLHEKGARVEATVEGMDPFAGGKEVHPRHFLYDRPFFVFLWRDKAEWPYFGAWIGDASCLEPWK